MSNEAFSCKECGAGQIACGQNHCLTCGDNSCDNNTHDKCPGGGDSCSAEDVVFQLREVQPYLRSEKWIQKAAQDIKENNFYRGMYEHNCLVNPFKESGYPMSKNGEYPQDQRVKLVCGDLFDEYGIKEFYEFESSCEEEEEEEGSSEFEFVIVDVWCYTCFKHANKN